MARAESDSQQSASPIEGAAALSDANDAALAARLNRLAQDHSQAEIARKTGFSRNNVSRYARGTKVPLEFCAELVSKLGVNPAWILMGEGSPYLADVDSSMRRAAGDMLQVVTEMNAVTKEHLGALAGKQHRRALRELERALAQYRELRGALRDWTRPVFEKLLGDLDNAVNERRYERAAEIESALRQIAQVCDDDKLLTRLDGLSGDLHYNLGHWDKGLEYSRRAFLSSLAHTGLDGEALAHRAFALALGLCSVCRFREAQRVLRAAVALIDGTPGAEPLLRHLEWHVLWIDSIAGSMHGLPAKALKLFPLLPGTGLSMHGHLIRILLLSGYLHFDKACVFGGDDPGKAIELCRFAMWLEEPEALQQALDYRKTFEATRHLQADYDVVRLGCLRRAKLGEHGPLLDELVAGEHLMIGASGPNPAQRYSMPVARAQLARLLGERKQARRWTVEAEDVRASLGPELSLNVLAVAIHYRNVLELTDPPHISPVSPAEPTVPEDLRRAALAFFANALTSGLACFKDVAAKYAAEASAAGVSRPGATTMAGDPV